MLHAIWVSLQSVFKLNLYPFSEIVFVKRDYSLVAREGRLMIFA